MDRRKILLPTRKQNMQEGKKQSFQSTSCTLMANYSVTKKQPPGYPNPLPPA
uniref:Uncharacterized protein n=1 Tax=Anguilla anguilla TaxID=7936 RepID=A0A0E9QGQ9_ANGAN